MLLIYIFNILVAIVSPYLNEAWSNLFNFVTVCLDWFTNIDFYIYFWLLSDYDDDTSYVYI